MGTDLYVTSGGKTVNVGRAYRFISMYDKDTHDMCIEDIAKDLSKTLIVKTDEAVNAFFEMIEERLTQCENEARGQLIAELEEAGLIITERK